MSESVIEAFERLARDYLETPDINVQHTREPTVPFGGSGFEIQERTEISVKHHGDPEALEDLEEAHGNAVLSQWQTETRELSPGIDSDETVLVTDADFFIEGSPHREWSGSSGTSGAVSGSGASASATPEVEAEDESEESDAPERAWGDGLENPPTPAREVTEEPDGTRHVLVAADEAEDDVHVCDYPADEAEYEGSVKDLYDSLLLFAADPDLCEVCARTVILFYNLPEQKVMDTMEAEYDG